MNIDWTAVITALFAPVAVLVVKSLLDFRLAEWFVKHLSGLPLRGITRERVPQLRGRWRQEWGAGGSLAFASAADRQSYSEIRQLGAYLYAEFDAMDGRYAFFGAIRGGYIVGDWYSLRDRYSYFGAAQLKIVDSSLLEGFYLGHSSRTSLVGADTWVWRKNPK